MPVPVQFLRFDMMGVRLPDVPACPVCGRAPMIYTLPDPVDVRGMPVHPVCLRCPDPSCRMLGASGTGLTEASERWSRTVEPFRIDPWGDDE